MDAFESIVARVLEKEGYWVKRSVKIEGLTTAEKKLIKGSTTIPTTEVDLVAINSKHCIIYEVKSFLDSAGVKLGGVTGKVERDAKKYSLLNNRGFQTVITRRIREDFKLPKKFPIKYGLAAGEIYHLHRQKIEKFFARKKYILLGPEDLVKKLILLGKGVYINDEVTMTVKLLRNAGHLVHNKRMIEDLINDFKDTERQLHAASKTLKKELKHHSSIDTLNTEVQKIQMKVKSLKASIKDLKNKKKVKKMTTVGVINRK